MRYIVFVSLGWLFFAYPAFSKITIVEPTENDRKLQEFSFDPTKTFLNKNATDTVSYILEVTEHDPTYPYFQILSLSLDKTEKTEKPIVEFLKDNETVKVSSYRTVVVQERFKITVAFNALDIVTDPALLLSRKRVDLELGFHSSDQAKDAKDKTTVSFFYDHSPPSAEPKDETISPSDQAFRVEVKDIPTDVRYLLLAYGPESADTAGITGLSAPDILVADNLKKYNLCFQAIDISSQLTAGTYTFDGKNTVGAFQCETDIQNDTPYIAIIAFSDTAGNLTFSKNTSRNLTPHQLSGAIDETQANCVSAGISNTPPPRPPFFLWMLFALIGMIFVSRHLMRRRSWARLFVFLCVLGIAPSAHTQQLYDATGQLVTQPRYGFIELMYGFFPHPALSSGIAYNTLFVPSAINLSDGPSALLMGTQWNWLWTPLIDAGPFMRTGVGIQNGTPFFLTAGVPTISTTDEVTLLLIPVQAGGGVNLHLLKRLLSFNGRLGVQYSLFNQTFATRKDAGAWFGNFASFMELNAQFNLDWLEAWAAWGLFDDWGIQNTYLSAHIFYFTNLTGSQIVLSSNTAGNSLFQNLGWFFGFTFEI